MRTSLSATIARLLAPIVSLAVVAGFAAIVARSRPAEYMAVGSILAAPALVVLAVAFHSPRVRPFGAGTIVLAAIAVALAIYV
ncbi:MAG: hypothetical protein ACE5FJ_11515 [Gemmatimonadales bacterium]